jgi:group I intron endonuclease
MITNSITHDFYIGSAINYSKRKTNHLTLLKHNTHKNTYLQNSWNKYGKEAFTFEILEEVDSKEMLIPMEQFWIDTLSPTFNICNTAGSPLGVKHTDEARHNMSIAHLGLTTEERGHTKGCKCTICNHQIGINSPRYINREERICACGCKASFTCMINSKKRFVSGHNKSQLGRVKSKDTIDKQKASLKAYFENGGIGANKGKKMSDEQKGKMGVNRRIPILQYDINNNFIKEWDGINIAAKELSIKVGRIQNCLKKKNGKTGDFIWKYKFNN